MKFLYSISIIVSITTLLSCHKKEIFNSSNTKNSERKIIVKSSSDSAKTDNVKISLNQNIATSGNIENLVKSGNAKFISFGIANQNFEKFREKYGIDLKTEGCVIDSSSSKKAKKNNTFLSEYLTKKYGETWKKDLPLKPFGLDEI
jgi:hypothetical protein